MEEVRAGSPRGPGRRDVADGRALRRAGVLVPLFVRDGMLWVVLTRRTETVEHHRGQISFPGGAEEPEDETSLRRRCARPRRSSGSPPDDVRVLGAAFADGDHHRFLRRAVRRRRSRSPTSFRPAEAEIAEVIEVPVAALLDPAVLETAGLPGRDEPVLFYHYGPHVIWGATARMLAELLEALF